MPSCSVGRWRHADRRAERRRGEGQSRPRRGRLAARGRCTATRRCARRHGPAREAAPRRVRRSAAPVPAAGQRQVARAALVVDQHLVVPGAARLAPRGEGIHHRDRLQAVAADTHRPRRHRVPPPRPGQGAAASNAPSRTMQRDTGEARDRGSAGARPVERLRPPPRIAGQTAVRAGAGQRRPMTAVPSVRSLLTRPTTSCVLPLVNGYDTATPPPVAPDCDPQFAP